MAGQKGIVRRGDTTTHGGKVLEGEPTFVFYGEPAPGERNLGRPGAR